MRTILHLATLLILSVLSVQAQESAAKTDKPKTKLETFLAQDGVVIVQGMSQIGVANGQYGSSVSVESKEITNATSGKKEYGITVKVKETSRIERDHTSYVDYDEIDSVIKGLDYISKIDKSITKLDGFQADYRTRGSLSLSMFSSRDGSTSLAIQSGTIGSTTAYFKSTDIAKVRDLLVAAKQKLDSIK